jgi:hypothetical protein
VFPSLPKASISLYTAMFTLVLGRLISDTLHGCDFRATVIRNLTFYSIGVSFILMWLIIKQRNWSHPMRNHTQAAKDKKIGFLKDLLVWVLLSISSRIRIVTRKCWCYFRWKLCDYFEQIHEIKIFQIRPVSLWMIRIYRYCTSVFFFFLSLYYGSLLCVKFILKKSANRNNELLLFEIRLTIFEDPSFTTFWFLFNFSILVALEIIISNNSHTGHITLFDRNEVLTYFMVLSPKKLPLP